MELADLALTPAQAAEVELADKALVSKWLDACGRRAGLRSPAGWFLSGVRSGNPPDGVDESGKAQAVRLAERRVVNLGHALPSQAELFEELFGRRSLLEPWAHDVELRARMLETWRRRLRAPIAWPRL